MLYADGVLHGFRSVLLTRSERVGWVQGAASLDGEVRSRARFPHAGTPCTAAVHLGLVVAATQARRGCRRSRARTRRRFFGNFFRGETDPEDPGRQAINGDFSQLVGEKVFSGASPFGGLVIVTSHPASEQELPEDVRPPLPGDTWVQEWRQLRFVRDEYQDLTLTAGQSVTKVIRSAASSDYVVARADVLAAGTSKSLASVALCAAHASGAEHLLEPAVELRALVIGLGSGSLPLWLTHHFSGLVCDAVELDPVVVTAARDAMGLPPEAVRPCTAGDAKAAAADALAGAPGAARVRAYTCAGEDFVAALAEFALPDFGYDLVMIDAVDGSGKVPEALTEPGGPFLRGLARLLKDHGAVSLNLLVGFSGAGSSGTMATVEEVARTFQDALGGEVFRSFTPIDESSNTILGFSRKSFVRCGEEESMKECLQRSAEAVQAACGAKFSLARRVAYGFFPGVPYVGADVEMKYPVVEAFKRLF